MPEGWVQTALGSICRFQAGDAFGRDAQGRSSGDHPFIKVSDMNLVGNELYIQRANNWVSDEDAQGGYRLHPKGAVVFAKIGIALTYNRRRRLTRPTAIDNNMMSAVCLPEYDPVWFYYLLSSIDFNRISSGSALPYLTVKDLSRISIEVPSTKDQKAVASILGALDDKIELNRRMNETLEATARAIFKDWFVDHGPTRAKIEGRAPYLAAEIWSLFPNRLDDEGKPEGWATSTIGQEVEVVGGSTPSTKEAAFWGGDISWATPKDLSSLSTPVLLSTERQITEAGLSQIGSGLLPAGTVLLSSRAPIGYMAIAQIPIAVNQGFIAMQCNKRLSNVFVWLWTQANMETVHQNANGSTFQEISKSNFRPIGVTVAAPELLRAFDETARPLFDRIVANDKENRTLAATRDFLLPRLISGEVRVGDAASFV
ncbi:MAG: restriction endonuclease subunit S [Hyphomicrobiaceae bacterium]|nr:restriction endonuclease subunit S [Hyphomicrobiaceae bacterium]